MQITNQQAMQRLAEIKAKELHSNSPVSAYYKGLHLGMAEAFQQCGVISIEQYLQVTEPLKVAA